MCLGGKKGYLCLWREYFECNDGRISQNGLRCVSLTGICVGSRTRVHIVAHSPAFSLPVLEDLLAWIRVLQLICSYSAHPCVSAWLSLRFNGASRRVWRVFRKVDLGKTFA